MAHAANRSPRRPGRLCPILLPPTHMYTAVPGKELKESAYAVDPVLLTYAPTTDKTQEKTLIEEEKLLFPQLFISRSSPSSRLRQPQWKGYFESIQRVAYTEAVPLRNEAIRGAFKACIPSLHSTPLRMKVQCEVSPKRLTEGGTGKWSPASLPLCTYRGRQRTPLQPLERRHIGRRETADSTRLTEPAEPLNRANSRLV